MVSIGLPSIRLSGRVTNWRTPSNRVPPPARPALPGDGIACLALGGRCLRCQQLPGDPAADHRGGKRTGRGPDQRAAVEASTIDLGERRRQFHGRLEAILRSLGQQAAHDGGDGRGHLRTKRFERGGRIVAMSIHLLHERAAREWRSAGQQKEQRATEAVEVGTHVGMMRVLRLLRAHVVGVPMKSPSLVKQLCEWPGAVRCRRAMQNRDVHTLFALATSSSRFEA